MLIPSLSSVSPLQTQEYPQGQEVNSNIEEARTTAR